MGSKKRFYIIIFLESILKDQNQIYHSLLKAWLEGSLNEWSNDILDISKIKKQGYLDDYHINLIKRLKLKMLK